MTEHVGALLAELRQEAGLSQNGLARAAGLDPTHLNRIERGKQGTPRQATVLKLIHGLGLPLTDERAQRLLDAAGVTVEPAEAGEETQLPAAELQPLLRELRQSLLTVLDVVSRLEALIEEASRRR
jgi:transcriptional regulator with XRE-family HTH domain